MSSNSNTETTEIRNRSRMLFSIGWVIALILALFCGVMTSIFTVSAIESLLPSVNINTFEIHSFMGMVEGIFAAFFIYFTYYIISKPKLRDKKLAKLFGSPLFLKGNWVGALIFAVLMPVTLVKSNAALVSSIFMILTLIPTIRAISNYVRGNKDKAYIMIFYTVGCTMFWAFTISIIDFELERQPAIEQKQIQIQQPIPASYLSTNVDTFEPMREAKKAKLINDYNISSDTKGDSDSVIVPKVIQPNTNTIVSKNQQPTYEAINDINLPFIGKKYFNLYMGSSTGRAITIDKNGNTEVISDNGIEFKGVFTNPLPISNDTSYSFSGDEMVTMLFNNEVATGCDAGILMHDDSYMCVTSLYN